MIQIKIIEKTQAAIANSGSQFDGLKTISTTHNAAAMIKLITEINIFLFICIPRSLNINYRLVCYPDAILPAGFYDGRRSADIVYRRTRSRFVAAHSGT